MITPNTIYEIDSDEEIICRNQGEIFEYAANIGLDMEQFTTEYLSSDFCKRAFDTKYSRFQFADKLECWDFIEPELNNKLIKIEGQFDDAVAFWISYTYRRLYYETNISSAQLIKIIPFSKMLAYYPGMHTIEDNIATDIICKNHNINKITYKQHEDNDLYLNNK